MADALIHNKRDLIQKARSSQFAVIIIASVIIAASIIGIKILWAQRSYQATIIDKKAKASDQLEANIAAVAKLEDEFKKLESSQINSGLVLDALPSKYDFPALATSIEKMTAISDVELDSFVGEDLSASSVGSQGQPVAVEIPFSVSVLGSYENIMKFVDNMQKSIRPFNIIEMSIQASGEGNLQADFRMKTYYLPSKSLEIRKESVSSGAPAAATTPAPAAAPATSAPAASDVPAGVNAPGVTP